MIFKAIEKCVFDKLHKVSKAGIRYLNDRYIPCFTFNLEDHLESIREKQVIEKATKILLPKILE